MALQLALVIGGDPSGAKRALEETRSGIEETGKAAESAGKKFDWLPAVETNAKKAAEPVRDVGAGLAEAAREAPGAAKGIGDVATAVGVSAEKFSNLRAALVGGVGGLLAGAAIGALGEGFKAAAGAASEFAQEVLTNGPRIERDLKAHEELIKKIRGAYAEAQGAASSYGLNSTSVLRFEAQQNETRLSRDFQAAVGDFNGGGVFGPLAVQNGVEDFRETFGPLAQAILDVRRQLAEGRADVIAFREELARGAETLPQDSPLRQTAADLLEQTKRAAEVQAELARAEDLLAGLKGDADAAATALGGSAEKYGALGTAAAGAVPPVGEANAQIRDTGAAAADALPALREYDTLLKSLGGGLPAGTPSPARAAVTPPSIQVPGSGVGSGFAGGGFTGHGPADRIAGVVHGQEFVFDAETTRKIGVGNLEAMRAGVRGYAAGGFVGSSAGAGGGFSLSGGGGDTRSFSQAGMQALRGAFSGLLSDIERGVRGMDLLMNGAERLGQTLLKWASNKAIEGLFNALGAAIFGGGGSGTDVFPPAPAIGGGTGGLFDAGGYTGNAPVDRIAGFVHGQEYVFDAASTARIGVANLETMRNGARGYRDGGLIGGSGAGWSGLGGAGASGRPLNVVVNPAPGTEVESVREVDPDTVAVTMRRIARDEAGKEMGRRLEPTLTSRFGMSPRLARRF